MSVASRNMSGLRQFIGVFGFEWQYQTRRLSYAASILLLVFASAALVTTGFGPASLAINGAYIVTESMALLTLLAVFGLPMLCVGAVVRDDEYRMRELVGSRPISSRVLFGGRLAGVCAAALAAMAMAVLALALLPLMATVPPDRLLPHSATPYLSAFVLIAVPNTVFCVALIFVTAAVTRSTAATFVASIAIYAAYWVVAMTVDSPLMAGARPSTPESLSLAARLDPFALSAFFEQTRYWTPRVRNEQMIALTGNLLLNRIGVMLATIVSLAPLPWLLSRTGSSGRVVPALPTPTAAERPDLHASAKATAETALRAHPRSAPTVGHLTRWRHALMAVIRLEAVLLLSSWPFRVLVVLWAAMIGIEAHSQLSSGEYGTRMLASSGVLADVVPQALFLIGTLSVLYFAADVVHRERLLRVDGVTDATPVDNSALLGGKLLALMIVPVVFTVIGNATVMGVHAANPGLAIDGRVYAWHAFVSLWPLLVFTLVAVALQVTIGNRWLALFAGLVLVLIAEQGDGLGLEHPLLRFGASPRLRWSDLDGFGAPFRSWVAFQSLWSLGACVAIGVATFHWPRGSATPLTSRIRRMTRLAPQGPSLVPRALLGLTTIAFVALYVGLVRATTGGDRWQSTEAAEQWRVSYEKTFRHLATRPQPHIVDVQLDVSLEPRKRRADVHGTVMLENRSETAIDSVWVSLPRRAERSVVAVDGATATPAATGFDVQIVALPHALRPRERVALTFAFTLDRGRVRAAGFDSDVAENGTFLRSNTLLPYIGYQPRNEVADSMTRVHNGLGAASPMLAAVSHEDSLAQYTRAHGIAPAWFTVRATIHTDADQTALGPGMLVREWRADGRRHFQYNLPTPSTPMFAVTSARYAVTRGRYRDVAIELWHHQAHGVQAERLIDIATRSFATLEPHFGAYPHRVFRMIEVPAGWGFGAYALTGSIYLTEGRGLLADAREEDVDLMLRRIGHEVAHQWWGHTVDPLMTEGRLLIVESLAKLSEQLIVDAVQDDAVMTKMLSFDHDRYLRGRANTSGIEPTLLASWDDDYLYYGKGALAFHALREVLGDARFLSVLRDVVATNGGSSGASSARQLYLKLREAAPDASARALVDEWFTQRVVYDLAIDSATSEPVGGQTRIVAQVRARRTTTDSAGEHTAPVTAQRVAVGIFGGTRAAPVLRAIVRPIFRDGVARVDTTVSGAVVAVEVDPQLRLIDGDRSNNRKRFGVIP
jgi:ABC-2 type transport system permease protein